MADYFLKGTVQPFLPLTEAQLECLHLNTDDLPEYDDPDATDGEKLFLEMFPEHEDCWLGSIGLTAEKVEDGTYYLYAEEHAGDMAFNFLQEVLLGLDKEKYPHIVFEYAHVCSRMRPDGFGGGAWVITRGRTFEMNSGTWLNKKLQELSK